MAQWVNAGVIESRFEGDRVFQALQDAKIPFLMKSFLDTAYDGLYLPQKGWGRVMVPEECRDEAERIIKEIQTFFKKEGKDETE
jgi:hypothetical protein